MIKRNTAIIIMFAIFTVICSGCGNDYQHISTDEAVKMMETETDYVIVDVRTKEEYDKKHIKGAVLVPIADIKEGNLNAIPDKNKMLLIYCWTGRRAEESASLLAKRGYENVYEFGGMVNWDGETEGDNLDD